MSYPHANAADFAKHERPGLWEPDKALNFFDVANKVDVHLRAGLPVWRELVLVIFFHETGFSNIKQGRGSGPAVGFGQMEIFNRDKIKFFKWLKPGFDSVALHPTMSPLEKKKKTEEHGLSPALEKLTPERVLSNDDFAIWMHCKYFEWLFDEGYTTSGQKGIRSLQGMLEAQTGGGKNLAFVKIFSDGGKRLRDVIYTGDRKKVIDALNSVMFSFKEGTTELKNQAFKFESFTKYWDFTLPESEMLFGLRK